MRNLTFIFLATLMLLVPKMLNASEITGMPGFEPVVQIPPLKFSNEEFFSKADFIIEGRNFGHSYTYDTDLMNAPETYQMNSMILVTHIYKNDENNSISVGDVLNIIHKGNEMLTGMPSEFQGVFINSPWSRGLISRGDMTSQGFLRGEVSHLDRENRTIYFLTKPTLSDEVVEKDSNVPFKVNFLQRDRRASITIPEWVGGAAGLNDLEFDNMYELYKYMEQFEGVTVPLYDVERMRRHLRYDDGVFYQYLKGRNMYVEWRSQRERQQQLDSVSRLMSTKCPTFKKEFLRAPYTYDDTGNRISRTIWLSSAQYMIVSEELVKVQKSLVEQLENYVIKIDTNPTKETLIVKISTNDTPNEVCISLYDLQGRLRQRFETITGIAQDINMSDYPQERYLLLIQLGEIGIGYIIIKICNTLERI